MANGGRGKDWVAIILALGIATALNSITVGVLWDAIHSQVSGLSENATQILTGAFGGILGVLGSYIGYQAASRDKESIDHVSKREIEPMPEAPEPLDSNPHIKGQP